MKKHINFNTKLSWKKFDLHLHTIKTQRDNKDFTNITKDNVFEFAKTLKENNVSLIAITNHNIIDLDNFVLIKEELSKHNIVALIGVELNLEFKKNESFQANLIFNDENLNFKNNVNDIKKLLEQNKLNTKDENNKYSNLDLKSFLQSISNFYGDYIFILDYAKSSSSIPTLEANNNLNYWNILYFDFVEGRNNNNPNILIAKIKKNINIDSGILQIMGTDNRNFQEYPNNGNRIGWTGTFFLTEPSFYGLKQASFFNFLVYNNFDFKDKDRKQLLIDKDYFPILTNPQLSLLEYNYEDSSSNILHFYSGVNCIIGRRGSGKSKLFEFIKNYLDKEKIIYTSMDQNEIILILGNIEEKNVKLKSSKSSKSKLKDIKKTIFNDYIDAIFDKNIIDDFNNNIKDFISIFTNIENDLLSLFYQEINKESITTEEKAITILIDYMKLDENTEKSKNSQNLDPNINNVLILIKEFLLNISKLSTNIFQLFIDNFDIDNFIFNVNNFIKDNIKYFFIKKYISNLESKKMNSSKLKLQIKNSISKLTNILEKYIKTFIVQIFNGIKNIHESKIENLYLDEENNKYLEDDFYIQINYNINNSLLNSMENIKKILKKLFKKDLFSFFIDKDIFKITEFNKQKISLSEIDEIIDLDQKIYLFNNDITNKSPGEKMKVFIENLINKNNDQLKIILIDQPEDQLDAQTIKESIIDSIYNDMISYIQNGYQFIFVTHDPKIAINLSPMNFIICKKEDENNYIKYQNQFVDIFKDEFNSIVEIVDGSKEILRKRSEIYGKK